jgi:hypothetical protein
MIVFEERNSDWESSLIDLLAGSRIKSVEIFSKTGFYVFIALSGKERLDISPEGGFQLVTPTHNLSLLHSSVRELKVSPARDGTAILTNGDAWAFHTR